MSVLRRYLANAILLRFSVVLLGFVGMFSFFELVAELGQLGQAGYRLEDALRYVFFRVPAVAYEFAPLSALIGCLWAMAEVASSSEFTVARAAGYGPSDALIGLVSGGIPLIALVLILSELVMPWSDTRAVEARAAIGSAASGQMLRSGHWLRDQITAAGDGPSERYINLRPAEDGEAVRDIRIYEFDSQHRMRRYVQAPLAEVKALPVTDGSVLTNWTLLDAKLLVVGPDGSSSTHAAARVEFQSGIPSETLTTLMLRPERMAAYQLWRYVNYLEAGKQRTISYELALWKKILYPVGVIVMLVLALPVAYVQVRSGQLGLKVMAGIAAGIAFYLFNNLFPHLSTILGDWPAAAVVIIPSLIALLVALLVLQIAQRRAL